MVMRYSPFGNFEAGRCIKVYSPAEIAGYEFLDKDGNSLSRHNCMPERCRWEKA